MTMRKILGLILELNPLHNGHYHFIREATAKTTPDCVVAVVSGNYTMRGDLSVIDKHTKTALALKAGIDVVLELPFMAAVNSADYFAMNTVATLNALAVTDIAFGVELDDLDRLRRMKDLIDDPKFDEKVRQHLDKGLSYPTSCYRALRELTADQKIIEHFTLPNNTLAVQYLRSIERTGRVIAVTPIRRVGNNYYDAEATGPLASATAIRNLIRNGADVSSYLPAFCRDSNFIDLATAERNIMLLLKYRFLRDGAAAMRAVLGVTEGIENRFAEMLAREDDYQTFVAKMKTKRYTESKIKRLIMHMLLGTDKKYEEANLYYLRLLGASQKGLAFVRSLPEDVKARIITSFKNATDEIAVTELKASRLYDLLTDATTAEKEFKIPIIGERS
jgi:predicted nucleotidyltransferase